MLRQVVVKSRPKVVIFLSLVFVHPWLELIFNQWVRAYACSALLFVAPLLLFEERACVL